MKEILNSRKFRAVGFFVFIFLVFGGILLFRNLEQELTLPSDEWSRAIDLPVTVPGIYNGTFVQKEEDIYHVYTYDSQSIHHLALSPDLKVMGQSRIPVKVTKDTPYWIRDHRVLLLKNHRLILHQNDKKTVLAEGLDGMEQSGSSVVVWKEKKLFTVDLDTFTLHFAGEMDNKIENIAVGSNPASFLVITEGGSNQSIVHFIEKKDGNWPEPIRLFSAEGESVSRFDYYLNHKRLVIYYSIYGSSHFGLSRTSYLARIDLGQSKIDPKIEKLTIVESNGEPINEPVNFRLSLQHNKPVLLFATVDYIPYKDTKAANIFRAEKRGNKWIATNVSATRKPSGDPFWLNDHTVLWYDFESFKGQFLKGASQNPQVIARSLHIDGHDWSFASGDSLFNLSESLIVIVYALFSLVPMGLFLLVMYMVNINLMERNPFWVRLTAVVLFIAAQLYFIKTFLGDSFLHQMPDYLSFSGNMYLIPVVLGAFSWMIMNFARGKEWENIAQIFYFIGIDVWMLMLLVGPYLI
ncbi:MAG TPA: hypothetical protein VFT51_03855 [Bacillales bacterium]|nr:hypothetical protein [Bacillales bacterium]